jgi:hypothetical protein
MFRLQWSAPNFSGGRATFEVSSEEAGSPLPTVPLPMIRRKQIQQLDANPYDRRSGGFGRDVGISDAGAETSPPKPTTFFQNTSMLQRIDPRLNNTKCMSCGKGAV